MFKSLVLGVVALASFVSANNQCPETRQVQCVDDIREAYPYCEKAAEAKGKDFVADLHCMKYFYSVEQDCWPCICFIAEK